MQARARASDPDTSHVAADEVERSGKAQSQRELRLRVVRDWPGLTAGEIASRAGLERHIPSRRLPELREDGVVVSGNPRICTVLKSLSMTWRTPSENEQLELWGRINI